MAVAQRDQRSRELAAIHTALRQLGLDDDTYRALLREQLQVGSAKDLDERGRHKLLDLLRERGFKQVPDRRPQGPGDPQTGKIYALWGELQRSGRLRDGSAKALRSFVHRMTGAHDPRWLDAMQANVVIEGLKAWLARPLAEEPAAEQADAEP